MYLDSSGKYVLVTAYITTWALQLHRILRNAIFRHPTGVFGTKNCLECLEFLPLFNGTWQSLSDREGAKVGPFAYFKQRNS